MAGIGYKFSNIEEPHPTKFPFDNIKKSLKYKIKQNTDTAILFLQKAIKISPAYSYAYFNLAQLYIYEHEWQKAIEVLVDSRFDEVVELIDKDEFISDPLDAYENKIYCKGAPLKTGVIWNK